LLKALEGQFKKLNIKLPSRHIDHLDKKRSLQNFVMVLAIQYLESDMYRYFAKHYMSQRVADNRKVKVTKKDLAMYEGVQGRKPTHKRVTKESDWKTYYGSNKYLKEDIEKYGKEEFERYIIKLAPSKKLLTYYETQMQFMYQVLEKPELYYNDNILGKFFTKDFEYR